MSTVDTPTVTPWTPPLVECGDPIAYERDGQNPMPATVFARFGDVIDLTIYGGQDMVRGVRHKDDPQLRDKPHLRAELGCWTLPPMTLRLNAIEAQLVALAGDMAVVNAQRNQSVEIKKSVDRVEAAVKTLDSIDRRLLGLEKRVDGIDATLQGKSQKK